MMRLFTNVDTAANAVAIDNPTQMDAEEKSTKLIRPIASLHRVWKRYLRDGDELLQTSSLSNAVEVNFQNNCFDNIPPVSVTSLDSGEDPESRDRSKRPVVTKVTTELDDRLQSDLDEENIPEFDVPSAVSSFSVRYGIDSETESVISDYSEMADPVKEHLANVQIISCAEIDPFAPLQFIVQPKVFRESEESELDYVRRLRKTNFLSLAQEFAELKKQNAQALPFNLHEDRYKELQDSDTEIDETEVVSQGSCDTVDVSVCSCKYEGDLDPGCRDSSDGQCDTTSLSVLNEYDSDDHINSDVTLNKSDVSMHTSHLSEVPVAVFSSPVFHETGSRYVGEFSTISVDDICSQTDFDSSSQTVTYDKNERNFRGTLDSKNDVTQLEMMMRPVNQLLIGAEAEQQLLFSGYNDRSKVCQQLAMFGDNDWYRMDVLKADNVLDPGPNDNNLEICYLNEAADDDFDFGPSDCHKTDAVHDHNLEECDLALGSCLPSGANILARQAHLEAKARMAFAHVYPSVKEQRKSAFKMNTCTSAASQIFHDYGCNKSIRKCLSLRALEQMTLSQLQIVLNDIHEQIEVLNRDLMLNLMERDDLHMVQDSMIVDIEDLTGRAREYAAKVDSKIKEQKI